MEKKPILLMGGAVKSDHIIEGLKKNFISGIVTINLFNFLGADIQQAKKKSKKYRINLADFDTKIIL